MSVIRLLYDSARGFFDLGNLSRKPVVGCESGVCVALFSRTDSELGDRESEWSECSDADCVE